MQTAELKFDPNSPEIKAYKNELAHQFVHEGMMVAFPTCFPGMTTPITHDESCITALDINADGHVYGGTSGRQAHVFGASFHGSTGIVLDAGVVPLATGTVADLLRSVWRRDRFCERSPGWSRCVNSPLAALAGLDFRSGHSSPCHSMTWASVLRATLLYTLLLRGQAMPS